MIIKCENELIEIEEPVSIRQALKTQMEKSSVKEIIAARYNNEVVSLDKEIDKDGKIEFINIENKDGRYIYIRGALYIASKAISELYPRALLTVNYQLSNAMYCQIDNMDITEEMISETTEEINYFEQILYDTQNCSSYRELKEIEQELSPETSQNNKKKEEDSKIEKTEIDGFTIYIGKNNKQNDYLYSKISSPDDLWFHALNTPGSHVIVKFQNSSQRIEEKTILKIAKIAKQNSRAKNAAKASVVYTLRKYIKRPNKTKSGFVVYKNETEIVTD